MSKATSCERHILQLLPGSYIGGCERYAIRVSNYLSRRNYLITSLCGSSELSNQLEVLFVDQTRQKSIVIAAINDDARATDLDPRKLKFFQRLLKDINPTIIHAVLPIHFACISFLEAACSLGIPTLITYQLVIPRFSPPQPYQAAHERWCASNTTISAVSRNNQQLLSEYYQVPLEDIVVIQNCPSQRTSLSYSASPNRNDFCSRHGFQADSTICVTVGSLLFQKGHELILRAAPSVLRDFPMVVFLFIGDGPLKDDLQSFANALGVSSVIHFLGHQPNVSDFLSIADLFIFPSRFEGEPFALLEAAAAKVPIVSSAASGIAETFIHGKDALLFPVDDVASLITATLESLQDPTAAAARAEHAFSSIKNLDEGRMLDSTLNLIQRCIVKRYQ